MRSVKRKAVLGGEDGGGPFIGGAPARAAAGVGGAGFPVRAGRVRDMRPGTPTGPRERVRLRLLGRQWRPPTPRPRLSPHLAAVGVAEALEPASHSSHWRKDGEGDWEGDWEG